MRGRRQHPDAEFVRTDYGGRERRRMTENTSTTWLTQEAYDRLKSELDHLEGEGRTEIIKKIEAARSEGDLKENGGYHAAREEQAKQEARIRQLRSLLHDATVGEASANDGRVMQQGAQLPDP